MDRNDKILELAADAAFYQNEDGMFRIMYTCFGEEEAEYDDDGNRIDTYFDVAEEDGRQDEYRIYPHSVKDVDTFYITKPVMVADRLADPS